VPKNTTVERISNETHREPRQPSNGYAPWGRAYSAAGRARGTARRRSIQFRQRLAQHFDTLRINNDKLGGRGFLSERAAWAKIPSTFNINTSTQREAAGFFMVDERGGQSCYTGPDCVDAPASVLSVVVQPAFEDFSIAIIEK